jgi:hypothetical protein
VNMSVPEKLLPIGTVFSHFKNWQTFPDKEYRCWKIVGYSPQKGTRGCYECDRCNSYGYASPETGLKVRASMSFSFMPGTYDIYLIRLPPNGFIKALLKWKEYART